MVAGAAGNPEPNAVSPIAANNYASSLNRLQRFNEAKSLLRKTMPVARRVLGENHNITLRMRWAYARTLYRAEGATLDDLREAVTALESVAKAWKRVLGAAHPDTSDVQSALAFARNRLARAVAASEFQPPP